MHFDEMEAGDFKIYTGAMEVPQRGYRAALPFGALQTAFTLGELRAWCEQILGRRLDKSSFRRTLAERELVEPIEGETNGGAFRPTQLFRKRD